jgi:hypothetical protein
MNVEIGTVAAQFSEKEYKNGIFFRCSVYVQKLLIVALFRGVTSLQVGLQRRIDAQEAAAM